MARRKKSARPRVSVLVALATLALCKGSCCWCGKRYEPLPGYWEGAGASVVEDRVAVLMTSSGAVVVIPPSLAAPGHQHLTIELGGTVLLNESIPCSSQRHFHTFSLARFPELQQDTGRLADPIVVIASVIQRGVVVHRSEHKAPQSKSVRTTTMVNDALGSVFPFGWFVNYGGWLGKDGEHAEASGRLEDLGSAIVPVAPFEPGGLDGLAVLLDKAPRGSWILDLKHADDAEASIVVSRFKEHPAVRGWYIADEPDGAGNLPGAPIGSRTPRDVAAKHVAVSALDPRHPTFVSLNCLHSAPFYADAADILLLDPYPIGVNLKKGCNATFGCNGCDGCEHGGPADVAERLATVSHEILQYGKAPPALWVVLQAFGGEGHWSRAPTARELRCSVLLAVAHGASGVLLWLREAPTPLDLAAEAVASGKTLNCCRRGFTPAEHRASSRIPTCMIPALAEAEHGIK